MDATNIRFRMIIAQRSMTEIAFASCFRKELVGDEDTGCELVAGVLEVLSFEQTRLTVVTWHNLTRILSFDAFVQRLFTFLPMKHPINCCVPQK
jgi:hypothetical protein